MQQAERAVKRGAAWLDDTVPGWEDRVDVGNLVMQDAGRCILGQVFAAKGRSLGWLARLRGTTGYRFAVGRYDTLQRIEMGFNTELGGKVTFAELQEAWLQLLAHRRLQALLSTLMATNRQARLDRELVSA